MAAYLPYLIRVAEYAAAPLMAVLALSMYFDRPKSGVLDSIWSLLSFTLATIAFAYTIDEIARTTDTAAVSLTTIRFF
jgi:hypothetical protein